MENNKGIHFEWLDQNGVKILNPMIEARGWTPLNPLLSTAIAAFDGEYLVGCVAMQCMPHVGWLWIDPAYRGREIPKTMVDQMVEFLYSVNAPGAYLVADSPHSEIIAKGYKMTRIESPVYFKRGY